MGVQGEEGTASVKATGQERGRGVCETGQGDGEGWVGGVGPGGWEDAGPHSQWARAVRGFGAEEAHTCSTRLWLL